MIVQRRALAALEGTGATMEQILPTEQPCGPSPSQSHSQISDVNARRNDRTVVLIKWAASIVQIFGYGATAFGFTPWNIYLFLFGILGWFVVGVIWNDRAIMLIHIVALAAMIAGLIST